MRILLIEDDRLIGDGIRAGLGKLGFSLDWFTDGPTGRDALRAAPYDAVILDLSLPGLDGMALLREWRAAGQGCRRGRTITSASRSRWSRWPRGCRR